LKAQLEANATVNTKKGRKMKVGCEHPPTDEDALKFADELELVISEIANGKRKPQNIPMEPMCVLIQFARDRATPSNVAGNRLAPVLRGKSG
jgi:hypothetical protein